jgi:hypothetical protein
MAMTSDSAFFLALAGAVFLALVGATSALVTTMVTSGLSLLSSTRGATARTGAPTWTDSGRR